MGPCPQCDLESEQKASSVHKERKANTVLIYLENKQKASCTFGKYMCEAQSEIMETNLSRQREKSEH